MTPKDNEMTEKDTLQAIYQNIFEIKGMIQAQSVRTDRNEKDLEDIRKNGAPISRSDYIAIVVLICTFSGLIFAAFQAIR